MDEMDDFTVRGEGVKEEAPAEHPLDPEAFLEDDEPTLRPRNLDEFVGQQRLKGRRSTTYSSPGLQGSARRASAASSRPRWASASRPRAGRAWSAQATWRLS
jgi:hypothetical protein